MSFTTHAHSEVPHRPAFTLLEITVTLALLALLAALVAPAFLREPEPEDELRSVLSQARELAVQRAQTLVLHVVEQGAWTLSLVGDTVSISRGIMQRRGATVTFRVTPLGACFADGPVSARNWDVIACARNTVGENR